MASWSAQMTQNPALLYDAWVIQLELAAFCLVCKFIYHGILGSGSTRRFRHSKLILPERDLRYKISAKSRKLQTPVKINQHHSIRLDQSSLRQRASALGRQLPAMISLVAPLWDTEMAAYWPAGISIMYTADIRTSIMEVTLTFKPFTDKPACCIPYRL
jgi:hypothetical protein